MLRTLQTSNSETLWSTQNFILYFVCVDCTKSVASPHLTSARNSSLLSIGFISWSFLLLLRCVKYSTFCHKCEGTEAGSQSCESVLANFIRFCWVQNREEKSRAFESSSFVWLTFEALGSGLSVFKIWEVQDAETCAVHLQT